MVEAEANIHERDREGTKRVRVVENRDFIDARNAPTAVGFVNPSKPCHSLSARFVRAQSSSARSPTDLHATAESPTNFINWNGGLIVEFSVDDRNDHSSAQLIQIASLNRRPD